MAAEIIIEGVLLGLSTGIFCLVSCAPALVPFILGEDRKLRGTAGALAGIALGRFGAYLLVGALVGAAASALQGPLLTTVSAIAMIGLAIILIAFSFRSSALPSCLCTLKRLPAAGMPVAVGFLTGISPCPPFLLAISRAAALGSVVSGIALFAGFFAGTSVYLLLFLPLGWAGRWEQVRTVGRTTAVIAGVFYLIMGIAALV
jgi:sulfite exporter TauE/SafE